MTETTIDLIAVDSNGNVILTLNQFEPWDKPKICTGFDQRLNGYIHVITSGQLYLKYPTLKGKPLRVRLYYHYQPSPEVQAKLDHINEKFLTPQIRFELKRLPFPKVPSTWERIKRIWSLFKVKRTS